MSDFAGLAMVFAIAIANVFLYALVYKWMQGFADTIDTGVLRGVPVSTKYRRLLLGTSWMQCVGLGLGFQSIFSVGYLTLAGMASAPEVRMFAQMYVFFSVVGVVSWASIAAFWYFRLTSALRETKRD